MKQITEITADPRQQLQPVLEDNSTFTLNLEFSEIQKCWFFSVVYGNITINRMRLVLAINILQQWKNILPFGISCYVDADAPLQQDPFQITDLVGNTSRVKIYILTKAEINKIDQVLGL